MNLNLNNSTRCQIKKIIFDANHASPKYSVFFAGENALKIA